MESRNNGKYRNQCLTMHQPWASLLVHGIKRIEGRSWPAPIRGCLWIHAAGKVPDDATIKAMEDFYREIYAVNGITDLKFPQHYPVSRLLGCIEVVGCLRCEELACWKEVPEGVRLEGLTNFCWLCEEPQKLIVPMEMRGYHGVYNLERKIYEAAVGGLVPVESPLPVKFQLPNPRDPFSLKPGSISVCFPDSKASEVEKSSSLNAAIAGARAAASQYSKKAAKPSSLFSSLPEPKSSSIFSSLPPPKSLNADPLPISNISASSSEPNRKKVIQFKIPINPSLMKSRGSDDDDDDEKEREGKKSVDSLTQTPSVKSFLSSIPAPRNSSALGALPTASGSSRRSILEANVPASSSDGFEIKDEVGANPNVQNYVSQWVDRSSSASVGDAAGSAEYAVGDDGGGGNTSGWVSSSANYENYDSYAGYGNHAYYGQYESNWGDGSTAMAPADVSGMSESIVKMPGKRGRNEIPQEIVEVNQDELIKNRPREDQVKLTGIAFGPSYQPVSTKGKPTKLHKRKHQIGSLYFDMRQKEMELAERRSKGFLTKAETQAKYGW